jgi:hypothetical protein
MQDYATADEFLEAVLQAWNAEWQRVYAFDWAESQPFEDGGVDYAVFYTPSIKILSVLSQGDYRHSGLTVDCEAPGHHRRCSLALAQRAPSHLHGCLPVHVRLCADGFDTRHFCVNFRCIAVQDCP